MGHPKFKINNKTDRNNFLNYLVNNETKVLNDLAEHLGDMSNKGFISFWNKLREASYIRDTPQEQIWEDVTSLLYMLPPKRIEAIKVSLRAKRRSNKSKNKTQLTIDADVYNLLSTFANKENKTLSAAISDLLSSHGTMIAS